MAQNIPDIPCSLRGVEGVPNSSPETKLYPAGCVFVSTGADVILPPDCLYNLGIVQLCIHMLNMVLPCNLRAGAAVLAAPKFQHGSA